MGGGANDLAVSHLILQQPQMAPSKTKARPQVSATAGYSGAPLPKKLGIKDGTVLALVNAPPGFRNLIGEIPPTVKIGTRITDSTTLAIWFVSQLSILDARMPSMAKALKQGSIWIAWPKRSSGVMSDVSENVIRQFGLEVGLVDYKVCAIDQTWSGLLFTHRKPA